MGIVCFEHAVEQAAYVCDLAGRELCRELCKGVGGFVYEGVVCDFRVLVFGRADLEVVVLDFGVHGLYCGGEHWEGDVAGGSWAIGVWDGLSNRITQAKDLSIEWLTVCSHDMSQNRLHLLGC